ncbi:MAG: MFS transporter [Holosporaceae bacterium]|nr:MAG: MFS transporter [Holosporaceae bacterium]
MHDWLPFFGWYADKYGARETLVLSSILIFGLCIPVFMAFNSSQWFSILFGHILYGFLISSIIGVQPLFSQRLFPTQDRYTGISFAYSLGIGVVGGLTPMLLTMLTEFHSSLIAPSFYLMGAALGFLIILLTMPKRK